MGNVYCCVLYFQASVSHLSALGTRVYFLLLVTITCNYFRPNVF